MYVLHTSKNNFFDLNEKAVYVRSVSLHSLWPAYSLLPLQGYVFDIVYFKMNECVPTLLFCVLGGDQVVLGYAQGWLRY